MKTTTSVSVDQELLDKAKRNMINVSGLLNDAIRMKVNPKKSDAPEDAIILKCSFCGSVVDYGFLCESKEDFYCQSCQDKWTGKECIHNNGEHQHLRIPGFEGQHQHLLKKASRMA